MDKIIIASVMLIGGLMTILVASLFNQGLQKTALSILGFFMLCGIGWYIIYMIYLFIEGFKELDKKRWENKL